MIFGGADPDHEGGRAAFVTQLGTGGDAEPEGGRSSQPGDRRRAVNRRGTASRGVEVDPAADGRLTAPRRALLSPGCVLGNEGVEARKSLIADLIRSIQDLVARAGMEAITRPPLSPPAGNARARVSTIASAYRAPYDQVRNSDIQLACTRFLSIAP